MKIKNIQAFSVDLSKLKKQDQVPLNRKNRQPCGPMDRYTEYQGNRSLASPKWKAVVCVIECSDGTFGLGLTQHNTPVVPIINDHFRELLTGLPVMATEKCYDIMIRSSASYGNQGLTSFAISAVDLALWDLKGKLLGRPVYELIGGPQKDHIVCYATGFDIEWYLELGFKAVNLPLLYGPSDGIEGLNRTENMIAQTRKLIGNNIELMLDCWMALDVDYVMRLTEILKPYQLTWLEDYLLPQDLRGMAAVRERQPTLSLASGEHWYLAESFMFAAENRLVDIFQPDIKWCGGMSAAIRICHIAEAAGLSVAPHGGMNDPYGQHLVYSMPAARWGERSAGVSPPGVPLKNMVELPGTSVIKKGVLIPSDAPGFGIEVDKKWLNSIAI